MTDGIRNPDQTPKAFSAAAVATRRLRSARDVGGTGANAFLLVANRELAWVLSVARLPNLALAMSADASSSLGSLSTIKETVVRSKPVAYVVGIFVVGVLSAGAAA